MDRIDYTNNNLMHLGKAFLETGYRSPSDPDYRGWNKCIDAVWVTYRDMMESNEKI